MQGVGFEEAGRKLAVVVTGYVPVENCSSTPAETFEVRKSSIEGIDYIVGYMHSHKRGSPEPSEADLAGLPRGQVGAVWCEGELAWYTPGGEEEVVAIAAEN